MISHLSLDLPHPAYRDHVLYHANEKGLAIAPLRAWASTGPCNLLKTLEFRRNPLLFVACRCASVSMAPPHVGNGGAKRGMAQSGSASALGAEGRGFESLCPDQGARSSTG